MNNDNELKSYPYAGIEKSSSSANVTPLDQPALSATDSSSRREDVSIGTGNAEALSTIVEERRGAVEAARAVAQLTADWLARTCKMAEQVDDIYLPEIVSSALSYEERTERIMDYVKLQSKLLDMCHTANVDYLHCHGIYRDHVSMLAEMVPAKESIEEEETVEQVEAKFKVVAAKLKQKR